MVTLETTQTIPLTPWKDGTIRVKGSRMLVDMIIYAYKNGECPEDIFDSFPSDVYSVADIYSIIAYYLSNKEKFEKYLAKREAHREKVKKEIESMPGYKEHSDELRAKILERWKERQK